LLAWYFVILSLVALFSVLLIFAHLSLSIPSTLGSNVSCLFLVSHTLEALKIPSVLLLCCLNVLIQADGAFSTTQLIDLAT
jgi:hypothetical protein